MKQAGGMDDDQQTPGSRANATAPDCCPALTMLVLDGTAVPRFHVSVAVRGHYPALAGLDDDEPLTTEPELEGLA